MARINAFVPIHRNDEFPIVKQKPDILYCSTGFFQLMLDQDVPLDCVERHAATPSLMAWRI